MELYASDILHFPVNEIKLVRNKALYHEWEYIM